MNFCLSSIRQSTNASVVSDEADVKMATTATASTSKPGGIIDYDVCLWCKTAKRLVGKRFCGQSDCTQSYIRACAYCRAVARQSGFGRFCSEICRQQHITRTNTPRALRSPCQYFVTGNFQKDACPHGNNCWGFHPPPPTVLPNGAVVAVMVPSSHEARFIDYVTAKRLTLQSTRLTESAQAKQLDSTSTTETASRAAFEVCGQSFLQASAGRRTIGKMSDRIILLKPNTKDGYQELLGGLLFWKSVLFLAEDVNLHVAIQHVLPLRHGAYRLANQAFQAACKNIADQLHSNGSSKASTTESVKVRICGSPPSVVAQAKTWFAGRESSQLVIAEAKDFDWVVSILYLTSVGTYYVGVERVPTDLVVGNEEPGQTALRCHCVLNGKGRCHLSSVHRLSPSYVRKAFLRKLWNCQDDISNQSHRRMWCTTHVQVPDNPLTLPIRLDAAVSRAHWKLAEVLSSTGAWNWAVQSAETDNEAEGNVIAMDLGAAPGGWSYQVSDTLAM